MNKVWTERRIFTEEQIVTIQPNETQNGIVLRTNEANSKNSECRLYLSYNEAETLAKQLIDFIKDNQ